MSAASKKKNQETLLRLLKQRFGNAAVSATIRATDDPEQLDQWLDRSATAATLDKGSTDWRVLVAADTIERWWRNLTGRVAVGRIHGSR